MNPEEAQVKKLEEKAHEVYNALPELGGESKAAFFKLLHWPGYTTLQDTQVALAMLESMRAQAGALKSMHQALETHVKNASSSASSSAKA